MPRRAAIPQRYPVRACVKRPVNKKTPFAIAVWCCHNIFTSVYLQSPVSVVECSRVMVRSDGGLRMQRAPRNSRKLYQRGLLYLVACYRAAPVGFPVISPARTNHNNWSCRLALRNCNNNNNNFRDSPLGARGIYTE